MKPIFYFAFALLLLASCKKDDRGPSPSNYLETVQKSLKDSLSSTDFAALDFTKAKLSGIPRDKKYYLRVPFKNVAFESDFLVIRTTYTGQIVKGKIVHIEGEATLKEGQPGSLDFNGSISLSAMNRKEVMNSKITKGFIESLHLQPVLSRTSIVPGEPPGMMPEVIVVAYVHSSPGISWSTWMNVQSFFSDISSGGGGDWWNTGYYWPVGGGGGGSSSGCSYSGGMPPGPWTGDELDPLPGNGQIPLDDIMPVDFETVEDKSAIDLQKYINCFNAIPDAGATCTIEIFADIPVDKDPNKIFNIQSQSPGHTFLQIKKINGDKRTMQNIGFYPKTDWKTIVTNAPIDGKFVDNGEHEFNCSLKMDITPAQLTTILNEMLYLKNRKYDIDNFNCTDWALDVFNSARTNKLEIPLYDIPGNVPSTGTRMPNGLYNKLKEMKNANHPETANITIDILKGWVASSYGPCN